LAVDGDGATGNLAGDPAQRALKAVRAVLVPPRNARKRDQEHREVAHHLLVVGGTHAGRLSRMSIIDRVRALFGGKPSGAEYGAATGGAVAATSSDDPARNVEPHSDSGGSDGGGWGDGGGGGDGDGGSGS
jgi:hypothetical protein